MANANGSVCNGSVNGSASVSANGSVSVSGSVNNGFITSQDHLDEQENKSDTTSSTNNGYTTSQNGHVKHKITKGGVGASTNLNNNYQSSPYVEEGRMMSLQLPTGRKGFMGDIGFAFGGAEYDETTDPEDWSATPLLIESVTRGSIADKAGLEPGDEIIKINGVTVKNAARSLPVSLIRDSEKKIRMLIRKGKGGRRTESRTFSKDQLQEFYDAFSLYDRSNKGKIPVKVVPRLCRMLGYNETAIGLDDAISAARTKTGEPDGDKIRLDTFIDVMKQIMKHQDLDKDVMLAYAAFDPGRKGYFNIRQLRDAFLASSRSITPLEMAEIFRKADPDFDGRVKEQEFTDLLFPLIGMY